MFISNNAHRFTCGERKVCQNIKKSQNIMKVVVAATSRYTGILTIPLCDKHILPELTWNVWLKYQVPDSKIMINLQSSSRWKIWVWNLKKLIKIWSKKRIVYWYSFLLTFAKHAMLKTAVMFWKLFFLCSLCFSIDQ